MHVFKKSRLDSGIKLRDKIFNKQLDDLLSCFCEKSNFFQFDKTRDSQSRLKKGDLASLILKTKNMDDFCEYINVYKELFVFDENSFIESIKNKDFKRLSSNIIGWLLKQNNDCINNEFELIFNHLVLLFRSQFFKLFFILTKIITYKFMRNYDETLPKEYLRRLSETVVFHSVESELSFDLVVYIMNYNVNCDVFCSSIKTLVPLYCHNNVECDLVNDLLDIVVPRCAELEVGSLVVFNMLIDEVSLEASIPHMEHLGCAYSEYFVSDRENNMENDIPKIVLFQMDFVFEDLNFQNMALDFTQIDTRRDYTDLLTDKQQEIVNLISPLLQRKDTKLSTSFLTKFISKSTPEALIASLTFLRILKDRCMFESIVKSICDHTTNPKYDIYLNYNEKYVYIRNVIFTIIKSSELYYLLNDIFNKCKDHPYVYAEMLLWFTFFEFPLEFLLNTDTIRSFSQVTLYFMKNFDDRCSFLFFNVIISSFEDNSTFNMFILNPELAYILFWLMFCKNSCIMIVNKLINFLSNDKDANKIIIFLDYTEQCLFKIFELYEDYSIVITNLVIFILNISYDNKDTVNNSFHKIASFCFNTLINKPSNIDLGKVLSNLVLKCYLEGIYTPSNYQMIRLVKTYKSVDDNNHIITLILSFLSFKEVQSTETMFFIEHETYIVPYVSLVGNEGVVFLYKLCQYSITNCKKAHDGHFDLLIIEAIRSNTFFFWSYSFDLSIEKAVYYEILSLMSSIQSSLSVALGLISLSIPKNKEISKVEVDNFISFNQIFSFLQRQVRARIIYDTKSDVFISSNVARSDVQDGFTLYCNIFVDKSLSLSTQVNPIIFKISDSSDSNSITLFLESNRLLCRIYVNKNMYTFNLMNVHTNQWSALTFHYYHKDMISYYCAFLNDTVSMSSYESTMIYFSSEGLTIQFGGYEDNTIDKSPVFCILGDSYLLKGIYSYQEINRMSNEQVEPIRLSEDLPLNSQFFSTLITFVNEKVFLENLIPFFSLTLPPDFSEQLLLFFTNLRDVNTEVCNYITKILSITTPNYNHYQAIYSIALEKPSNAIFKIMFDISVWCHSLDIDKISSHWVSLVQNNEVENLWDILSFQCIMLSFEEFVTDKYIKCPESIRATRKNIVKLLLHIPHSRLTKNDLFMIVSCLVNCECNEKLESLILIGKCFLNHRYVGCLLQCLCKILSNPSPVVFLSTIQTLKYLNNDINAFNFMIFCLTVDHQTDDMLKYLISDSEVLDFTFPFISQIACYLNSDVSYEVIKIIYYRLSDENVVRKILKYDYWYLWLVIFSIKRDFKDEVNYGLDSIVKILEYSQNAYNILDIVCVADTILLETRSDFLLKLLSKLLLVFQNNENIISNIILLFSQSLLMTSFHNSPEFLLLLHNSAFCVGGYVYSESIFIDSPEDLFFCLAKNSKHSFIPMFGPQANRITKYKEEIDLICKAFGSLKVQHQSELRCIFEIMKYFQIRETLNSFEKGVIMEKIVYIVRDIQSVFNRLYYTELKSIIQRIINDFKRLEKHYIKIVEASFESFHTSVSNLKPTEFERACSSSQFLPKMRSLLFHWNHIIDKKGPFNRNIVNASFVKPIISYVTEGRPSYIDEDVLATYTIIKRSLTYSTKTQVLVFKNHMILDDKFILLKEVTDIFVKGDEMTMYTLSNSYLINFSSETRLQSFLTRTGLRPTDATAKIHNAINLYNFGIISMYELILLLNKYSGRSYNNLNNYPIFPRIVDFQTQKLISSLDSQSLFTVTWCNYLIYHTISDDLASNKALILPTNVTFSPDFVVNKEYDISSYIKVNIEDYPGVISWIQRVFPHTPKNIYLKTMNITKNEISIPHDLSDAVIYQTTDSDTLFCINAITSNNRRVKISYVTKADPTISFIDQSSSINNYVLYRDQFINFDKSESDFCSVNDEISYFFSNESKVYTRCNYTGILYEINTYGEVPTCAVSSKCLTLIGFKSSKVYLYDDNKTYIGMITTDFPPISIKIYNLSLNFVVLTSESIYFYTPNCTLLSSYKLDSLPLNIFHFMFKNIEHAVVFNESLQYTVYNSDGTSPLTLRSMKLGVPIHVSYIPRVKSLVIVNTHGTIFLLENVLM